MNAKTQEGKLSEKILDEYYQNFQKRNPFLKVFSAHLHMDEATPHLHIDFVPFTAGSKRGLDTRVSLKQALANQGFKGNSKHETEWNQWVQSEKEELSKVMNRYGVEWEQKGTHEKHLSVYEYEKKIRSEEVEKLTNEKEKLNIEVEKLSEKAETLLKFESDIDEIYEDFYESEEYKLPEPPPLMTAKNYKIKFVEPLIKKLTEIAKFLLKRCLELQDELSSIRLWGQLEKANTRKFSAENSTLLQQNEKLRNDVKDYKLLRKMFGCEQIDALLKSAREAEKTPPLNQSQKSKSDRKKDRFD